MKFPFQTVALIGKHKAPEIAKPLLRLAAFLLKQNVKVVVDNRTAEYLGAHDYKVLTLEEIGRAVDLAVVMGGDGTMLNITRVLSPCGIPLVGVNQGRLGFLTDLTLENMEEKLAAMLYGKFIIEERLLLAARVIRGEEEVFRALAFNELVVHRTQLNGLLEFEVLVDGEYLSNQRADGLIVATPTGSTAYALSAGAPILHPNLNVLELVPICPHTLSNRPLVVHSSSVLEILMHRSSDIRVHFDSHTQFDLQLQDKIIVTGHPQRACLLHPEGHSYYHTLREKLLWNQTL